MEISLQLAQSYFKDRVKELRNQVPFGDAFVFLGAITVLRSVVSHANHFRQTTDINRFLQLDNDELGAMLDAEDISRFFSKFVDGQPDRSPLVTQTKIAYTHDQSQRDNNFKFYQKERMRVYILQADAFLDAIDAGIDRLFESAKTDTLLAAKLYVSLNERKLFGYGQC